MINVAIIGCGKIATDIHIPCYQLLDGVKIVAVSDTNKKLLSKVSSDYGIRNKYVDFHSLLANEEIDIVDICTPGHTHYQLCLEAIEHNVNIIVEKPITLELKETEDLNTKSKKNGTSVCVMHNYRFRDPVLKATDAIKNGLVGNIRQMNSIFHEKSIFDGPSWKWEEVKIKGLLYEKGLHYVDFQTFFAGAHKRILKVHKKYDDNLKCITNIYALIEYKEGIIGILDLQLFSASHFAHFELYGSANDILIKFIPDYFRLYSGADAPQDELYYDFKRIYDLMRKLFGHRFGLKKYKINHRLLAHYRVIDQFIKSLNGEAENPITIDDVMDTMKLLDDLSKHVYENVG